MAPSPEDGSHLLHPGLGFYRDEVAPSLPPVVLDFHTHVWTGANKAKGGRYRVTSDEYPVESLLADARRAFPDREYRVVCFGNPGPTADNDKDTTFVAAAGRRRGIYPLMVAGAELGVSQELLRRRIFATDYPVAAIRGRRVRVSDHWVDIVQGDYPISAYRVPASGIHATFMSVEIALAIIVAARRVGLAEKNLHAVFFQNGMSILRGVRGGEAVSRVEQLWTS